jgi:hypothetical protein
MKSFPMKMNTSPMLATTENLAGFLKIRKKASFAEEQKFFPWSATCFKG